MGRTVMTYHDAVAAEQTRLLGFRRALRKEDQKLYDCLWEWARRHTQAGSYLSSASPLVPVLFSILIEACREAKETGHRLSELEERMAALEREAGATD